MKTVFTYGGENAFKKGKPCIQVEQHESGEKLFSVTYGFQEKKGLTYAQATKELGECIFHYLACESVLDNDGE